MLRNSKAYSGFSVDDIPMAKEFYCAGWGWRLPAYSLDRVYR